MRGHHSPSRTRSPRPQDHRRNYRSSSPRRGHHSSSRTRSPRPRGHCSNYRSPSPRRDQSPQRSPMR
ncbi:hypothetical protein A2U01_0074713, partial [Trifolium medium]|nr:hypothetical protein [Trifolium medium]